MLLKCSLNSADNIIESLIVSIKMCLPMHEEKSKTLQKENKKFFFLITENPQKFCIIKLLCDMLEIIHERNILLHQLMTLFSLL